MNVVISPRAIERITEVNEWWREHRPAAGDFFQRELDQIVDRFEAMSSRSRLGTLFEEVDGQQVWRVRLPKSQQYVFYTVDEVASIVRIRTVWGARRRRITSP